MVSTGFVVGDAASAEAAGIDVIKFPLGPIREMTELKNLYLADFAEGSGSGFKLPDLVTGIDATPTQPSYVPVLREQVLDNGDTHKVLDSSIDPYAAGLKLNQVLDMGAGGTGYTWVFGLHRETAYVDSANEQLFGSNSGAGYFLRLSGNAGVHGLPTVHHAAADGNKNGAAGWVPDTGTSIVMTCWHPDDDVVYFYRNGVLHSQVALTTAVVNDPVPQLLGNIGVLASSWRGMFMFGFRLDVSVHEDDQAHVKGFLDSVLGRAYYD